MSHGLSVSDSASPVLTLIVDGRIVETVRDRQIPFESGFHVPADGDLHEFACLDASGGKRSYIVKLSPEELGQSLHVLLRVTEAYSVHIEIVSTAPEVEDPNIAFERGAPAILFQPFFLPETDSRNEELRGEGLCARGLIFPGKVSRGNLSLLCRCDCCSKSFRLGKVHTGFSFLEYYYCSEGPHTLFMPSLRDDAPGSGEHEQTSIPPCKECGGTFGEMNPFLCPHCLEPFIDFRKHSDLRDREYYGVFLFESEPQHGE